MVVVFGGGALVHLVLCAYVLVGVIGCGDGFVFWGCVEAK